MTPQWIKFNQTSGPEISTTIVRLGAINSCKIQKNFISLSLPEDHIVIPRLTNPDTFDSIVEAITNYTEPAKQADHKLSQIQIENIIISIAAALITLVLVSIV